MQEGSNRELGENESAAFLTGLRDDFRRLREDPKTGQEHEQEMALWNSVLADGLGSAQDD